MPQRNVYVSSSLDALLELELRADPDNTPGKLLVALARATYLGAPPPRTLINDVIDAVEVLRRSGAVPFSTNDVSDEARRPLDLVSDALRLLPGYVEPARHEGAARIRHGMWQMSLAQPKGEEYEQTDEGRA